MRRAATSSFEGVFMGWIVQMPTRLAIEKVGARPRTDVNGSNLILGDFASAGEKDDVSRLLL